ncbi:MAG: hypothetical protein IJ849_12515 [Selenomonadaceae bacterium]|nr:hypothetical protein [Selenomonadaceae bacterium]
MMYAEEKLEQELTGIDFSRFSNVKESLLADLLARRRGAQKPKSGKWRELTPTWGALGDLRAKRLTDEELDYAVAAGSGLMPPTGNKRLY